MEVVAILRKAIMPNNELALWRLRFILHRASFYIIMNLSLADVELAWLDE